MMAERYQDVWSVSANPMPVALAQGGRQAKAWAGGDTAHPRPTEVLAPGIRPDWLTNPADLG